MDEAGARIGILNDKPSTRLEKGYVLQTGAHMGICHTGLSCRIRSIIFGNLIVTKSLPRGRPPWLA